MPFSYSVEDNGIRIRFSLKNELICRRENRFTLQKHGQIWDSENEIKLNGFVLSLMKENKCWYFFPVRFFSVERLEFLKECENVRDG